MTPLASASRRSRSSKPDRSEFPSDQPRIAWVTRSFLDYRVPVFREIDRLTGGRLFLLYSGDYVPEAVQEKAKAVLGDRAIPLHGEWKLGPEDSAGMANTTVSLRIQPGLLRRISTIGPDVVIGDGLFKWTAAAVTFRLWKGVPLVVNYERTLHTERRAQWYRRLYRKLVVRWIDIVNCNGRLCQEYVRSLGVPTDQTRTGHMVADFEALRRRAETVDSSLKASLRKQFDTCGILLLFVGRLIELKGLEKLLLEWGDFERRHPEEVTLLIVGTGPLEDRLHNLSVELGLKRVRFAGRVHHDEIATMYAASDALVIPTLEDNWSLVVPEAMSCGLPILCSVYNGCWPELVRDGENGWLFDPLNPTSIHQALDNLVEGKQSLAAMGGRSIEIIASGHTPRHAALSILESCRTALSRQRGDHR